MINKISNRAASIVESATSGMATTARQLKSRGIDVVNLSQGEPDFKTPDHVCQAAKVAVDSGKYFSYPPTAGYMDLREAIAEKYNRENNVSYKSDNVVVSNGAKQALSNVMLSILNAGDEVIIFAPYWVSYYAQVKLAEATPVVVNGDAGNGFKVTADQLKQAITKKTRAIVFSSPSNPTGIVYSRAELSAFAAVVIAYPDVLVIADEIYEHINYTDERTSFASLPGMFERTATINGFGKCFAMTGWRVGYVAAPTWLSAEVTKLQGHLSSANCSIAQRAAFAAVTGSISSTEIMVKEYRMRRDLVFGYLQSIQDVKTVMPQGAFYFFPDLSRFYGCQFNGKEITNSNDMCSYILNEGHVALVPGEAFGNDSCVRISYAASTEDLKKALSQVTQALNKLR